MAISTNGTVLTRLAGALYNTQMSYATYSEVASLDPASLANALYTRDFGSSTDSTVATTLVTNLGLTSVAGLTNWVAAQLTAAGTGNKGAKIVDLLNGFAQLSSDATYGTAATTFNTKVTSALALSQTAGNTGGTFAAVGTVVSDEDTAYTLTTSDDEITAGDGDDTFTGTTSTFEATDVLDGGDGADTLTVKLNASIAAELANIETINAEFRGASADLDLENAEDVTSISVTGSSSGSISNMDIATAVTLASFEDTLTIGLIDDGESDDTLSLALNTVGDTSATTAVNAIVDLTSEIEAIEIATTTAASYVTIDDSEGTLESAEITGAQALTIAFTSTGTDFATVDASAATGAVTLTLSTTSDVEVTGGSGADTIALGTTLTSDDTIDGGAGTDTLKFTMSAGTYAPTVSNVEKATITLADTAPGILSAANISGAVAYSLSATSDATTFTAKNVVSGSTFTSTDEDVQIWSIDTVADATVTITLNDADDAYDAGAISVTDATTVNFVSSGDGGNTATTINFADAETVSITALDDADFTTSGAVSAENAIDVTLATTSDGELDLDASTFLDDAEFLETLTINAVGDDTSDVSIGAIGGTTAAESLQEITITASSKADVTFGIIDAAGADIDTITITAASGSVIADGVITADSVTDIVLSGAGTITLDANHVIASLDSVDATGVTGTLTLNLGDSGTTAGADVATGTGTNTIYLSKGSDVVTLSYDSDDYYGTDTIYLNDAVATSVEIEGLETGSAGDVIELDLSALELNDPNATVVNLINPQATGADVSTDTVIFSTLTGATDLDAITAVANVLVLDGDIDSEADLITALAINGDFALTAGSTIDAADGWLVLWDDGTDSYLTIVQTTAGSSDGSTFAASDLDVTTVLTLVGVADCTDVNAANFGTTINA